MSANCIIGISQRVDNYPERNERRDALDQMLSRFIIEVGGTPVPIPNGLVDCHLDAVAGSQTRLQSWLEMMSINGIVLSGGNDIGEASERDTTEATLLDYARAHTLPVLGICRGLQMIGYWSGVKLTAIEEHLAVDHNLNIPHRMQGWPKRVNSYHSKTLETCPDGFQIAAHAPDGSIEAIIHNELSWEGWMWHPERVAGGEFSAVDIRRARNLFLSPREFCFDGKNWIRS